MPCVADGFPAPTITWYRGATQISGIILSSDSSARTVQLPETNTLFIASLMLDDEGLYTCRASNDFSTVTATAQLTVTGTGILVKVSVALINVLMFNE